MQKNMFGNSTVERSLFIIIIEFYIYIKNRNICRPRFPEKYVLFLMIIAVYQDNGKK